MAQAARLPDDHPERLTAPTTRRLERCLPSWEHYWSQGLVLGVDERLWLEDWTDRQGADNGLYIDLTSREDFDRYRAYVLEFQRRWTASGRHLLRYGTWARYRWDIEFARDTIRALGWTLTEQEADLLDALDSYGRAAGSPQIHTVPAPGHSESASQRAHPPVNRNETRQNETSPAQAPVSR